MANPASKKNGRPQPPTGMKRHEKALGTWWKPKLDVPLLVDLGSAAESVRDDGEVQTYYIGIVAEDTVHLDKEGLTAQLPKGTRVFIGERAKLRELKNHIGQQAWIMFVGENKFVKNGKRLTALQFELAFSGEAVQPETVSRRSDREAANDKPPF